MNATLNTYPLTGFYWKENYIWGIGMQLCWNQLAEDILHGPVTLETQKPGAQELIALFNQKNFDQSALFPAHIYTKSGFGPETLEIIKEELAERFPNRSTDTLSNLHPDKVDLICFSYLFKKFQHQSTFQEIEMRFLDMPVKGFTPEPTFTKGLELVDYDNDENFVLRLLASNEQDEIILIKGNEGASIKEILHFLAAPLRGTPVAEQDKVQIPNIQLEVQRTYAELIGSQLTIQDGKEPENYVLTDMEEQINLSLNYLGATVENEAVMSFARAGFSRPKNLIFDQPFWLLLKERQSSQPYLIVRVNNTALLENMD